MDTSDIKSSSYKPGLVILPFVILFFIYGMMGRCLEASYLPENLTLVLGKASSTSIEHSTDKKARRSNYVTFVMNGETYVVPSQDKIPLTLVEDKIKKATQIAVWRRNTWQRLLGLGNLLDIYQLKVDDETLVSIDQTRSVSGGMFKFLGGLTALLSVLWIYALYKYRILKRVEAV